MTGNAMRRLREGLGLRRDWVADDMDISEKILANLEHGDRVPRRYTLYYELYLKDKRRKRIYEESGTRDIGDFGD